MSSTLSASDSDQPQITSQLGPTTSRKAYGGKTRTGGEQQVVSTEDKMQKMIGGKVSYSVRLPTLEVLVLTTISHFTTTSQQDHLSHLAPEILAKIFSEAECIVAVSKHLLSFSQRQLYQHVRITTWAQLGLFIRTIVADRGTSITSKEPPEELVVDLTLASEDPSGKPEQDTDQSEIPKDSDLISFFARLTSLQVLKINDRVPCVRVILAPEKKEVLPELQILHLKWVAEDAYHPATYAALDSYPKLTTLFLLLAQRYRGQLEAEQPNVLSNPFTSNKNVKVLFLWTPGGVPLCKNLLGYFSNLEGLEVITPSSISFQPGLSLSQVNPGLKNLVIEAVPMSNIGPAKSKEPLELIINRFINLKTLIISPSSYTPKLFPLLSKIPLAHLSIETNDFSEITFSALAGLFTGPHKILTLQSFSYENLEFVLFPDFTFEDAQKVEELAEEAEVELGGNLSDFIMSETMLRGIQRKIKEGKAGEAKEAGETEATGVGEEAVAEGGPVA